VSSAVITLNCIPAGRPHAERQTHLLGGSIHDRTDSVGRLLFNVLAMVAEFEST
jgi:hypothetical protein